MEIGGISAQSLSLLTGTQKSASATDEAARSFANILQGMLDDTNATDTQDQLSNLQLMTGELNSIHTATIAAEKAEIALALTLSVRNKVLDAYKEIMSMQI